MVLRSQCLLCSPGLFFLSAGLSTNLMPFSSRRQCCQKESGNRLGNHSFSILWNSLLRLVWQNVLNNNCKSWTFTGVVGDEKWERMFCRQVIVGLWAVSLLIFAPLLWVRKTASVELGDDPRMTAAVDTYGLKYCFEDWPKPGFSKSIYGESAGFEALLKQCAFRQIGWGIFKIFISFRFFLFRFFSFHFVPVRFLSCHFFSFHSVSFRFISFLFVPFRFISLGDTTKGAFIPYLFQVFFF